MKKARNPLLEDSLQTYKKHPGTSWVLSLAYGTFAALILLVCFWMMGFSLLLIPLVILPALFATYVAHFLLEQKQMVTFGAYTSYFFNYFRRKYRSSFRFFSSLMWCLLFGLLASFIFGTIAYFVVTNIDRAGFESAEQAIIEAAQDASIFINYGSLKDLLGENYYIFSLYTALSLLPPVFVMWFVFFYHISRNSLSIYLRLHIKNADPIYIQALYRYTYMSHKSQINRDYWYLNWPLYLLMFVGFIAGVFLSSLKTFDVDILIIGGLIGANVLPVFFYPFYFANMESMFKKWKRAFQNSSLIIAQNQLKALQKNIIISEEEKNALEEKLKEMANKNNEENGGDDSSDQPPQE